MKTAEWLTIAAILLGPILAVQAQRVVEAARDRKNQRLSIFKKLMGTRATPLSPVHVEALNMIDIEFAGWGKKNAQVRLRWKEYLDNLTTLEQDHEKQKAALPGWLQKNQDLLAELLHDMSKAVGYDFDKVQIRRGIYAPIGHANLEIETQLARRMMIEVLSGRQGLLMDVRSLPPMQLPPATPTETPPANDQPPLPS